MQYHDLRVPIRVYMKGNRKKHVKKEQNPANQALFFGGGGVLATRRLQLKTAIVSHFEQLLLKKCSYRLSNASDVLTSVRYGFRW